MYYPLVLAVLITLYAIYNVPGVKGWVGESLVFLGLSVLDRNKFIIMNDIYIPAKDGMYTQIDHIVIGPGGITVIETKNYGGKPRGNSRKKYWSVNRNGTTSRVLNPIRQNSYHISMLRENCPELDGLRIYSVICLVRGSWGDINTSVPITGAFGIAAIIRELNETDRGIDIQDTAAYIKKVSIDKEKAVRWHRRILGIRYARRKNNRCPRCGAELLRRMGRRGEYYICGNYPKCTFRTSKTV